MRSKIALFLAAILFFNIILPSKVLASSVQDQSKPIFGLTADQVVEKYNQLSDQQKDQVLRSLGNTSIFANSLFGNIFNSSFGILNDAIKKLGDLFFQANGVVYKLGSSALAWVSRLIDKVFNNDLNDLNISQPVINDFYLNTRGLSFESPPFFLQPHKPSFFVKDDQFFNTYVLPLPDTSLIYACRFANYDTAQLYGYELTYNNSFTTCVFVDLDIGKIIFSSFYLTSLGDGLYSSGGNLDGRQAKYVFNNNSWSSSTDLHTSSYQVNFSGDYHNPLLSFLNNNFCYLHGYYLKSHDIVSYIPISNVGEVFNVTDNTYYNYIYNIPVQTPLNVSNIVSNTAINYDPVENLIQYLPDNYNIEQNFTVVNNYYISSGSAITGQAIDVNIVSPGVIDVRVINPEDLTQQVTNNVSKDIINNTDVNFGDLNFIPSINVGLNAAKDSIDGIVPVTGSSIVAQFVSGIPPDWLALGFVFLILFIAAGFGMSIIRH